MCKFGCWFGFAVCALRPCRQLGLNLLTYGLSIIVIYGVWVFPFVNLVGLGLRPAALHAATSRVNLLTSDILLLRMTTITRVSPSSGYGACVSGRQTHKPQFLLTTAAWVFIQYVLFVRVL